MIKKIGIVAAALFVFSLLSLVGLKMKNKMQMERG